MNSFRLGMRIESSGEDEALERLEQLIEKLNPCSGSASFLILPMRFMRTPKKSLSKN